MKKGLLFCFLLISFYSLGQVSINKEKDTLSLLFAGDIMGHSPQITSAYNKTTQRYEYEPVFAKVAPIFRENDYVNSQPRGNPRWEALYGISNLLLA